RKLNNTVLLPITSDLLALSKCLEQEIKTIKEALKKKFTTVWSKLASLTLTRVILFNKRSGEAARMTVEQYASRPLWNSSGSEAVTEALSPFEQELAKTLVLVNIVGKRGRHVPVLLTAEMKESIDLLIRLRSEVEVLSENPFLFALGGAKVSRLLIAVDQGETQQFAGKALDEINLKDLPVITEEAELSDEEDERGDEVGNNGEIGNA
ncbi:hypothetical protein NQ314_011752, partial [Rhamnusium bicolor]